MSWIFVADDGEQVHYDVPPQVVQLEERLTTVNEISFNAIKRGMELEAELLTSINIREQTDRQLARTQNLLGEKQAQRAELRKLLKIARCPNTECCQGSIPHQVGDSEWEAEQCQFCYEREALLQEKGE